MPLHSLRARLRRYIGDRRRVLRRAARVQARLPVAVVPLDAGQDVSTDPARTLTGWTRDLSGTGLTLLLPAVRVGDRYLTDRDGYLGLRLDLPDGPLYLLAAPARFEQLAAAEYSFLLGARILKLGESERARYLAYLRTLAAQERRAADEARGDVATAAGQVLTPVFVAEAFDRFIREQAPSRQS